MTYHILNGDALLGQFPVSLEGARLVARECLVDGPVNSPDLHSFWSARAAFLEQAFEARPGEYFSKTVPEFEAMRTLPQGAEVNLWFEEDLFCQVNLWFVASLLHAAPGPREVFLVLPQADLQYGFGGMTEAGLLEAFEKRIRLGTREIELFGQLWGAYRKNDLEEMVRVAERLSPGLPFVQTAVQAHLDRIPRNGHPGRPAETLLELREEIGTDFGPVFRAFCEREAIYGFGDLQVKRIWEALPG